MRYILLFVIGLMIVLPLSPQEKVEEQVSVDWWVLPIFVLDKSGNSVLDLKDSDVDLRVNNQKVTGFMLYKRAFSVEQEVKEKESLPAVEKKKIVFLLFDTAFSTKGNFERSKEIAKDLVLKLEDNTLFSVLSIDPFTGPIYAGGPLSDKEQVTKLIDKKIKWAANSRSVAAVLRLVNSTQMQGRRDRGSRLDRGDLTTLTEQRSSALRKSNITYFRAFQTLYHALNSIKDNKFIYLFSEGISLFARQAVMHGGEEYWFFIKQTAGYLGRCGAVLFIVNPAGETLNARHLTSGEDSLRFLARESGGKYMEGAEQHIKKQIESMSRAYYEIAFADTEAFEGGIRCIDIRPGRKGLKIHTLRSLERSKTYSEMNTLEREVLIVNLLNPSPLLHSPLKTSHLKIEMVPDKNGEFLYTLDLPRDFKGTSLELYKITTDQNTNEVKVKKEDIVPAEKPLQIAVSKKDIAVLRLVLINERANKALVQGIFNAQAEKESILADKAHDFKKKVTQMKQGELSELNRISLGAMSYCGRLAEAAFHFICKEKVSEVLDEIRVHKAVRESEYDENTGTYRSGFSARNDIRAVRRKTTNKYVNDYQLVSNKGRVSEQRKPIKGKMKKIALIPLSLLGPANRDRFHFRFLKNEKVKGVKTAVIECFPKDPAKAKTIYGRMWVDLSDYSIMRISVNPVSIGGYSELLKLARYYNSKLILTCEMDFYQKHGGIRFPTRVFIRELYSGGLELRNIVKKPVWERSKTTYTFDDYKFFDVAATSREEEAKK